MAELHVGKGQQYATPAKAAAVAKSGGVFIVHEGVYAAGFRPPAGTAWVAAEGERPVIDGGWDGKRIDPATAKEVGIGIGAAGVTLNGFEVRNIKGRGVTVGPGGHDFTMRNCIIHDCVNGGFGANGSGTPIRNVLVEDCYGYRLSMSGSFKGQETPVNGCWLVKSVKGVVMRRVRVHQGHGEGMAAGTQSEDVLFEACVVSDTKHWAFGVNRCKGATLRNCVAYHTGDPDYIQGDGDVPAAYIVGDEISAKRFVNGPWSQGVLVEGCVSWGYGNGFGMRNNVKPGREPGELDGYDTRADVMVRGCTFVTGSNSKSGIAVDKNELGHAVDVTFERNVFVFNRLRADAAAIRINAPGGQVKFSDNVWTTVVPAGLPESNRPIAPTALVAPFATPFALDNLRPRAGGPLDGAGYGALAAVGTEPPPPPPPDPPDEPEPPEEAPDWAALRELAAEVGGELASISLAADATSRKAQVLENRIREYEVAAQGDEE